MKRVRKTQRRVWSRILHLTASVALIAILVLSGQIYFRWREVRTQDNCTKLRREIAKYDWDQNIAFAIAMAESKCDPNARGDEKMIFTGCFTDDVLDLDHPEPFAGHQEVPCSPQNPERQYGYSVGAFQVRILPGRTECDSFDLVRNVKCAYRVYEERGRSFTPWSVYLDGKYREFLSPQK